MDLDENIYDEIVKLCNEAEEYEERCENEKAFDKYEEALDLIPGDIEEYEISSLILVSMGDLMFIEDDHKQARNYYFDALNCVGGIGNPYILFSIGKCFYMENNFEKAKEYLIKTYMLDGMDLFYNDDNKYFDLIEELVSEHVKLNSAEETKDDALIENNKSLKEVEDKSIENEKGVKESKDKLVKNNKLLKQMEDQFFKNKFKYMDMFEEGDIDGALKLLWEVWEWFPEPKVEQDLFYLLVEDLINIYIETKKFDLANKYISLLFVAGLKRVDDGTREFIAGRLAYEQGEMSLAKQLFYITNSKSSGRMFRGKENKKYRELIKK
ncbi:hypothetical protein HBE96_09705 [Clostridium sp. P21]|uniref:Tetratricopeptide repeat protein n=1 Tax=Clostridium muellerianum TaxID=2716538 RepID=A0A7Y0HPR7_9CLOT|nr:hypothetical protein [Clostridium muellerianum]NMM62973.1 hypothetical protein [Clostridium muellerianum]